MRVHLLLHRRSDWADVESSVPYAGRVKVLVKRDMESVAIRAPEWVPSQSPALTCEVNGRRRETAWDGRYVEMRDVSHGDVLVFGFPMCERTVEETIGGVDYTLDLRGNNVVAISPPGRNYPFYQHDT